MIEEGVGKVDKKKKKTVKNIDKRVGYGVEKDRRD